MYRNKDFEIITNNIDKIKIKAAEEYKTKFEPTFDENKSVVEIILQFVKDNNLVLYGGVAQHLAIKLKNNSDGIYDEKDNVFYKYPEIADVEFYSTTPIVHTVELCNILYKNNFKYVRAIEAVHHNTYKIFVNFINYCDISYIPFKYLPTLSCSNLKIIDPYFMFVDTYRIITDPLTSYWRLDKAIIRFQKIITYYPLKCNADFTISNHKPVSADILNIIYDNILTQYKFVIVGPHAFKYYFKKATSKSCFYDNYYEIIVDNYDSDLAIILKIIKIHFNTRFNYVKYHPFFVFMDNRCEIFIDGVLSLIVHGDNKRCTIYKFMKKKNIYMGTFSLVCLYLLYWAFYYKIVCNNVAKYNTMFNMLCSLIKVRDEYLDAKNITVLDKSPFQDFRIKCNGDTMETLRYSRIYASKNPFRYVPSENSNPKIPIFKTENISGLKFK